MQARSSATSYLLICIRPVNRHILRGNKSLLRKRISTPIRSQEKWLSDLQVENASDIDWKDAYTIAFHCTASTKLRTFHYKFLHRRIATNDFLKKINLKQSDKCSFCQREIESISHLFLRCSATVAF